MSYCSDALRLIHGQTPSLQTLPEDAHTVKETGGYFSPQQKGTEAQKPSDLGTFSIGYLPELRLELSSSVT